MYVERGRRGGGGGAPMDPVEGSPLYGISGIFILDYLLCMYHRRPRRVLPEAPPRTCTER